MSEYLRIASIVEGKSQTGKNVGSPFLGLTLADGSKITCFDVKLFDAIRGQGAITAEVDRTRPNYPKITAVLGSDPPVLPSANGVAATGKPSDRDTFIMRECALKAAVEAMGMWGSTSATMDDYTGNVRKLADSFLSWLEDPTPF